MLCAQDWRNIPNADDVLRAAQALIVLPRNRRAIQAAEEAAVDAEVFSFDEPTPVVTPVGRNMERGANPYLFGTTQHNLFNDGFTIPFINALTVNERQELRFIIRDEPSRLQDFVESLEARYGVPAHDTTLSRPAVNSELQAAREYLYRYADTSLIDRLPAVDVIAVRHDFILAEQAELIGRDRTMAARYREQARERLSSLLQASEQRRWPPGNIPGTWTGILEAPPPRPAAPPVQDSLRAVWRAERRRIEQERAAERERHGRPEDWDGI